MNGSQRSYPSTTIPQGESGYSSFQEPGAENNAGGPVSKDALEQQRENLRRGLEITESGERLSFNFLLDSIAPSQRPSNNGTAQQPQHKSPAHPPAHYSFSNSPQDDQQPWNTLPKNCEATCPLDSILLNLYQKARSETSSNSNSSSSPRHPPAQPSIMSLLNPSQSVDTLSQTMADITTRFPHIDALPTRVATVWGMFIIARWCMYPTQENYDRLPEWAHPCSSQSLISHPAWMDYIPWPLLRDRLIADQKTFVFDHWFIPFTVGLSVNWPYEPMDCLLSTAEGEDPVINPVFEQHISKISNWSVSPLLMETYPQLKGGCYSEIAARCQRTDRVGSMHGGGYFFEF